MKDKELKLEEMEVSRTLGGDIKYSSVHQSRWFNHRAGCVAWTDAHQWWKNKKFVFFFRCFFFENNHSKRHLHAHALSAA